MEIRPLPVAEVYLIAKLPDGTTYEMTIGPSDTQGATLEVDVEHERNWTDILVVRDPKIWSVKVVGGEMRGVLRYPTNQAAQTEPQEVTSA